MKTRFNSYDIVCNVTELQRLIGMRVNQVYDIDNKTYLIRFQEKEQKEVLLLESGIRFHTTVFEWPKNVAPSGFTMKLRKHLKNKRLEKLSQLGVDRIIDLQFGTGDASYHIILEMYDRGNIILTDCDRLILNILRPHVEGEEIRFAVREKYPESRAKERIGPPDVSTIRETIENAKPNENLKRVLNPVLDYGASVIDHVLIKHNLSNCKVKGKPILEEQTVEKNDDQEQKPGKGGGKRQKKQNQKLDNTKDQRIFDIDKDLPSLMNALNEADKMLTDAMNTKSKGYLILKKELKPLQATGVEEYFEHNIEYHPFLFEQFVDQPYKELDTFDAVVDEFYSTLEGQKIDMKTLNQEREILKKLTNVKKDHEIRLENLSKDQMFDKHKAELITRNQKLVDAAILAIRTLLAQQMSWIDIQELVKQSQTNGDAIAKCIKQLKLEINHISMYLTDPYNNQEDEDDDDDDEKSNSDADNDKLEPCTVDIDLALSAYANARCYYDHKRMAAKKEQRTIESSTKALKSAERRTQQTLKEMKTLTSISKARKVYWFEKFYWFISSENFLVIGGRDQQQNELIVKRYMRSNDIYVHAEIQGASSVVIKNPTGNEVPPKTLLEAGTMAISYSVAWEAKVVTNAYWVHSEQISKTAPTGEYLGTGSFMVRGRKNFLPQCHLILGLSFLFKLEDSSVERHLGERKIRTFDDTESIDSRLTSISIDDDNNNSNNKSKMIDQEIDLGDDDDDEDDNIDDGSDVDTKKDLNTNDINEEVDTDEDSNNNHNVDDNPNDNKIVEKNVDTPNIDEEVLDDENNFPDTHIIIEHNTGKVITQSDPKMDRLRGDDSESTQDTTLFLGDDQPFIIHAIPQTKIKQQKNSKVKKQQQQLKLQQQEEERKKLEQQKSTESGTTPGGTSVLKRRQKSKLKKIKEKYKDQDEEERRLRMELLGLGGSSKNSKKLKKSIELDASVKKPIQNKQQEFGKKNQQVAPILADIEEDDSQMVTNEIDMIDSLTGCPVDEDELLFAIPVVAPYQALQNYKYKVKLTPGPGKRGKASKMAMLIFSKDKLCTAREKDLFKGVKDETLARNIPGKVKLSAPQLQKFKK